MGITKFDQRKLMKKLQMDSEVLNERADNIQGKKGGTSGKGQGSTSGKGQGNGGGWPSTTGKPSGGGRSNNSPKGK